MRTEAKMAKNLTEKDRAARTAEVLRIAQAMLSGVMDVIEGARALAHLRHDLVDDFDPDFIPFVGIDSETDHLPAGNQRGYWAPDALAEKDLEKEHAAAFHRDRALAACNRLVQRFGHDA